MANPSEYKHLLANVLGATEDAMRVHAMIEVDGEHSLRQIWLPFSQADRRGDGDAEVWASPWVIAKEQESISEEIGLVVKLVTKEEE